MSERPFSVIHVGFANTGSSSLQLNFFSNRDDIFYVGEPYRERGGIFSNIRCTEDFQYDEAYILRLCNEQIFAKSEGRTIVISDETFCDTPQRYFASYLVPRDLIAFRLFKLFQPAKIIFTIRRQEDYISSMYLNLKRNSAFLDRMPVPPLSRWYRGMLSHVRCNFLQNINFHDSITLYAQIFGRENVLVLPLERLIIDGPAHYLQELCDFIGIGLSEHDINRFARPQNVRMSQVKNIAAELLSDDRFFTFYSELEQSFGRERVEEFLDARERAVASLEDDDLAHLKERVGPGNRLLAEEYGLELEWFGYALAAVSPSRARPKVQSTPLVRDVSENRLTQLQSVIDAQRHAHADQIGDIQATFEAQREVFAARIQDLEATLQRERDGFVAQFKELEATLQRERDAFRAHIKELEATLQRERDAFLAHIKGLDATLQRERDAFVPRIRELETTLQSERDASLTRIDASLTRIRELEGTVENERSAYAHQLAAMQTTLNAERQAFVARIHELEATLQAEREAFIARITELDRALQRVAKLLRWTGLSPLLAMRQRLRRKH
jgi:hypothetical protein